VLTEGAYNVIYNFKKKEGSDDDHRTGQNK